MSEQAIYHVADDGRKDTMRIDEIMKREAELNYLRYIAALPIERANIVVRETEQLVMLFNALPTVTKQAA